MSNLNYLNIVIYKETREYNLMYQALSGFYGKYDNVKNIFVTYSNEINSDHEWRGDILIIKGEESLIPGLMQKTMDAMILEGDLNKYDFIVRSNISTVINFNQLDYLISNNINAMQIDYLGGIVHNLCWLDPESGIIDDKNFGVHFASGTMIVLSPRIALKMIEKRHYIDFTLVDDVAIGCFVKRFFPEITALAIHKALFYWNQSDKKIEEKLDEINDYRKNYEPIAWRNKSLDRLSDAQCMKYICNSIS